MRLKLVQLWLGYFTNLLPYLEKLNMNTLDEFQVPSIIYHRLTLKRQLSK